MTEPLHYRYTSTEMRKILGVSGCELMHLRTSNQLSFSRKGNAILYELPRGKTVLTHPLGKKLIEWYRDVHNIDIDNQPTSPQSRASLELLLNELLIPIERKFGRIKVTYGFTSAALKQYIVKNSPEGTCPELDQHSSFEVNSKGRQVCSRGGAACDISASNIDSADIVRFIVNKLNYDRIYFYGNQRPLHISVNSSPNLHLQVMKESTGGKRYPAEKAFGKSAMKLAEDL